MAESVSKLVATGFSAKNAYLTFQEYFERLGADPTRWGRPMASLLGALDAQVELGVAAIGGKDSMSGSFENIDVPPTLVSFAVAAGNTDNVVSPEFKLPGSKLVLLSPAMRDGLLPNAGSLKLLWAQVETLIKEKKVLSAYTPSMGGLAEALFKMGLGNRLGVRFAPGFDAEKLFGNEAFMNKTADAIAKQSRTRPLSWLVGGYRIITNSKKPINTMADLKGLKIRVPAVELQLAAFRSWGVEPHPLAWSETFNGLQQGVVDGQENPHAINRDQKFWEVQKYITNIHYMLWVGPMLVSDPWFRKLDPQTKALVEKAAKEAAAYEWKWSAEQDESALKECLARGMVINDVSDEPAWTEAARSVWPQFYDKVGGKAVVDEALAIMQQ